MAKSSKINIHHLAKLSDLTISSAEAKTLTSQLEETLNTVATLGELNTAQVKPTSQVTGLQNVFREDVITPQIQFTQAEALANAKQTYKGYFLVPAVIES